jgi:general secretion pathway protein D
VRVIPLERLNALLIVTVNPRYLELAATLDQRLDQIGGTSGGSRLFVYQVRNGKAENLAQLVGDLFASRRTTTSPRLSHPANGRPRFAPLPSASRSRHRRPRPRPRTPRRGRRLVHAPGRRGHNAD